MVSVSIIDIYFVIVDDYKYEGGEIPPNGHIHFVTHHANCIDDFDPTTDVLTVIVISSVITHSSKYIGGVLVSNGHI